MLFVYRYLWGQILMLLLLVISLLLLLFRHVSRQRLGVSLGGCGMLFPACFGPGTLLFANAAGPRDAEDCPGAWTRTGTLQKDRILGSGGRGHFHKVLQTVLYDVNGPRYYDVFMF